MNCKLCGASCRGRICSICEEELEKYSVVNSALPNALKEERHRKPKLEEEDNEDN